VQRKLIIALLFLISMLVAAQSAQASQNTPISQATTVSQTTQSQQSASKVVIVLMDNISWNDIVLANNPALNKIIGVSAIGLQNNHPQTAPSRPKNALTVGAGAKADVQPNSEEAYNSDEIYEAGLALDAYKLRTGKSAGTNKVVELGMPSIIKDNENGLQDFTPGYMADILDEAGRSVAVYGNADTSFKYERGTQSRVGVAIAMNSSGTVRYGDVGKNILTKDPDYPYGLKSNFDRIETEFEKHLNLADLIVIELGDTVRADKYGSEAIKSQSDFMRTRAINDSVSYIERLMNIAGNDTLFIITSISPPGARNEGLSVALEQMTPIIVHGPGFKSGGLISDTTNRETLVSIIDIAPTVLNALGLPSNSDMIQGSVMKSTSKPVTPAELDSFNNRAVEIRDTRQAGILTYIYMQLALYIFAAVLLAFKTMLNKKSLFVIETLIFTAMGFPLFSFYTTKLGGMVGPSFLIILITILVSLIFASILVFIRRDVLLPIVGMSVLTVGALSIDIIMGAPSIINSIFGYDLIRGARFFGIGNEAMSILLANTLLLFGIMLEKSWSKWTLAAGSVIFAATTIIIGFPGLGTNTDGPITTVAAFCAMILTVTKSKNKARNVMITVMAMVAVLTIFGIYDISTGPRTHIGKSILLIMHGGFREVFMIANRKLAVNLMILRFSTWSNFLLFTLALVAFMRYRPVGLLKQSLENHKGISAAISASIVAGVVGFAFNDSGILVPAIIMSYMVPTVLYLMLWEQYRST
jgi:hypothetical protein